MEGIHLSSASYLLLAALAVLLLGLVVDRLRKRRTASKGPSKAPGPEPWPVLGSLHLLGGYEVPYQAFDRLNKTYGPVVSIKLGQVQCLVLSSLEHIREVLITKGDQFDGRPGFVRYHQLFDGDKQNSLAFSDWSEKHKMRREMLRDHTFPRAFTDRFHLLDSLLNDELHSLCGQLAAGVTNVKPALLQSVANVFLSYFCNVKFAQDDVGFVKMVRNFDEIFYEVNQGYAADFMPWLMPLHAGNLRKMRKWSVEIRKFMVERIIQKRLESWTQGKEAADYVDVLVEHVNSKGKNGPEMDFNTAMFALEDIVGGHSAIANLIVKIIGFVAQNPQVQKRIQEEADSIAPNRSVSLTDRSQMPYTEATVLEAIRHISSPIVPHVANQTSDVAGYTVEKDTLIFLNNYTLNMSPELWAEPEKFAPERFISAEGKLTKPEHFLPFGGGRRSCMGYKLTQFISFVVLATLVQQFDIAPVQTCKVPLGNLALPYDTMQFLFSPRQ
ncbi:cytochrome P450 [Nesidiocoris tenuis]|uniref:Cytochrome P450 n=1 Tax=Nesidiocoris tenuis TaxID=355587 RepID=A0ABN7ACA2_9HEMI|nr:cytochrome P450 [Nesidiocoris tenuis]